MEFQVFKKIPRLFREIVVTEKLDGTNAQIYISDDGKEIRAGSRHRWITPENDNFGFATWVENNKEELLKLGPGHHYGEWWGLGIQRGYNINERRFSLFNTNRWNNENKPTCCHVVPILYSGQFLDAFYSAKIYDVLDSLLDYGSVAAPGFMRAEGIIVYHKAGNCLFKVTLENDAPKGQK